MTAPAPPKLIPKSRFGVSVWVPLWVETFDLRRPLERTLAAVDLHGLPLSPGTLTGGLQRIEPMFEPISQALVARQVACGSRQADETRWMVFVEREGKTGCWLFAGPMSAGISLRSARAGPR